MYRDLADFKRQHKAAGGHFFDRGAVQFFNSRVESTLLKGGYFVTSEAYNEDGPRHYAVREVSETDPRDITTYGPFDTKDEAREAVKDLRRNN